MRRRRSMLDLFLASVRDGVEARAAERVTADDALQAHPSTAQSAVRGDRFSGVRRTGRKIAALTG